MDIFCLQLLEEPQYVLYLTCLRRTLYLIVIPTPLVDSVGLPQGEDRLLELVAAFITTACV